MSGLSVPCRKRLARGFDTVSHCVPRYSAGAAPEGRREGCHQLPMRRHPVPRAALRETYR